MTSLDQLTTEQLEAAWRILCAPDWPDLHTLATSAARLKLVQGYALRHARGLPATAESTAPAPAPLVNARQRGRHHFGQTSLCATYDRKRAAAGDFDDKE